MSKTISISDQMHAWLKAEARAEKRTMTCFLERVALRGWDAEQEDGYDSDDWRRKQVVAAIERENA